jgi:hypothetical protein
MAASQRASFTKGQWAANDGVGETEAPGAQTQFSRVPKHRDPRALRHGYADIVAIVCPNISEHVWSTADDPGLSVYDAPVE